MFRDGALEVHLALMQQFWKRHSKRRKELDVSVATDIALRFHLSHQNLSTSVSQWSRTPGHFGLANVGALRAEGVHVPCGNICCYAPYEIVVIPRCKAHDPQQIWGLGVPGWGSTNIISHPATRSTWYSTSWLSWVARFQIVHWRFYKVHTSTVLIPPCLQPWCKICHSTWTLGLTYQRLRFFMEASCATFQPRSCNRHMYTIHHNTWCIFK